MHLTRRGSGRGDKATEMHAHSKLATVQCSSYLSCSVVSCGHTHRSSVKQPRMEVTANILLEYFAGEKPLRMSQTSRNFEPLQFNYCVLARIVCHTSQYQYCDYIFAKWSTLTKNLICLMLAQHSSNTTVSFIFTYMYMYSAHHQTHTQHLFVHVHSTPLTASILTASSPESGCIWMVDWKLCIFFKNSQFGLVGS